MELTGKIINIGEVETFPSGFTKRTFVIQTPDEYPQEIPIELIKDATSKVTPDMLNTIVTVGINIKGREHNGKWYVSIQGWKITKGNKVESKPKAGGVLVNDDSNDGLPF